jgi:molybdopterin-guanine dinucleotide biosynthesis protein A
VADVAFDDIPYNPFFNINRLADIAEGEMLLSAHVAHEASMVV